MYKKILLCAVEWLTKFVSTEKRLWTFVNATIMAVFTHVSYIVLRQSLIFVLAFLVSSHARSTANSVPISFSASKSEFRRKFVFCENAADNSAKSERIRNYLQSEKIVSSFRNFQPYSMI